MLKDQIKVMFPRIHALWRFLKGFVIAALVRRKITFDGEFTDYVLWCNLGEAKLDLLYKNGNSHRNPLRLNIIATQKIRPSVLPEYYHYNPTLQLKDGIIRVFWRVSAFSYANYKDDLGRYHGNNLEDLQNFERIATGVLSSASESDFGIVTDENVLPEVEIINKAEVAKAIGYEGSKVYVEDPRAHEGTGRYITAIARFGKYEKNLCRMLLLDLTAYNGIIIPTLDPSKTEKNWIVIHELEDYLFFLNQSKPHIIEKVNIKTGVSERVTIQENESQLSSKNVNGGSPFVRIDSKHFIRVARLQFGIYGVGTCRISVLVLHDLEFKEVARSKPFVFNKLGVEICNGLMIKDDLVYFSWGVDDLEMYVGRCSKAELMGWFNENLQN